MIFTLKSYNDLGRCSYATLKDIFDTDKDEIFLDCKKVEIKTIEDLFPFLWQSPGIAFNSSGKSKSYFNSTGTHWHHDYDKSITDGLKEIEKLKNKMLKEKDVKKANKLLEKMNFTAEHIYALQRICDRCDEEMEEQKKELIKENTKE